jgi:hypothetical protein
MALVANHSTVVVVADDGTSPVGSDEWNADHPVTGTVGPDVGARELLTADRTYYVALAGDGGSDSNDGLTALTPCLTVDHVYDDIICGTLDMGGKTITIQYVYGTYGVDGQLQLNQPWTGGGNIVLQGNTGNRANVVIDAWGAIENNTVLPGSVTIQNMTVTNTALDGYGLIGNYGVGNIYIGDELEFGITASYFITADGTGARILINGDWYCSDDAYSIIFVNSLGSVNMYGHLTLIGTPAYVTTILTDAIGALQWLPSAPTTGTATGTRYSASGNSLIHTFGGGPNILPGDVAGSTATGGQYT